MNVITLISIQALDRAKRDSFITNNWKIYRKEITMLTLSEGNRPAEKIGDFFVTPIRAGKINLGSYGPYVPFL